MQIGIHQYKEFKKSEKVRRRKMAGMLPGVEAARRRRVHQSSGPTFGSTASSPSFRRCSLSLYSSNSSTSSLVQERSRINQGDDEKLGQLAREAKERLDERLRAQSKSSIRRNINEESINGRAVMVNVREIRTQVYGSKKKKKKGWAKKLGWKAEEQEECAVCLEVFTEGENLVNLPCDHRFHSSCLLPWVETHAHCPCCRLSLFS